MKTKHNYTRMDTRHMWYLPFSYNVYLINNGFALKDLSTLKCSVMQ